ncbi:MAG: hypothetical protein EHM20_00440 [Alphaproteobacteria bacterium]|nr:MAG: hypothetical protein EHM20_00440 [Alphaproteobacteria bacterium]
MKINIDSLADKLESLVQAFAPVLAIPLYIFIAWVSLALTSIIAVAWFNLPYWEFGYTDYILASILLLLIWLCMFLQKMDSSKDYPEQILVFFRDPTYFSPAAREKLNSYSGTNSHQTVYYSVPEFKYVVLVVDKKKTYWLHPQRKGRRYFSDQWVMVDVNEFGIWVAERSSLELEGYKDYAVSVGGRTLIPWSNILRLKATNEDLDLIAVYKNYRISDSFSAW